MISWGLEPALVELEEEVDESLEGVLGVVDVVVVVWCEEVVVLEEVAVCEEVVREGVDAPERFFEGIVADVSGEMVGERGIVECETRLYVWMLWIDGFVRLLAVWVEDLT